jgi:hypothetical protein
MAGPPPTIPQEVALARHALDLDDDGHHAAVAIDPDDVRDAGRWEPVTDGEVTATELIFEDGDIVMEWVP